jgi:hypothetical protein
MVRRSVGWIAKRLRIDRERTAVRFRDERAEWNKARKARGRGSRVPAEEKHMATSMAHAIELASQLIIVER